jgi:CubicO group peptidase (beta-lactamase class C family)
MLNRILLLSLSLLFIHCEKKPDEKNESTLKDKDGNVSEYAVNFTPLSTVYKKRMADDIEYFYNKKFNAKDFSGGFLVAKNGEILFENYSGYAYKEKEVAITQTTPIHLASVSKVITAVTVLKLADQGKIKLDAFVANYLPQFPHKQTTVRMLLNHRSGLRNYAYFSDDKNIWNKKNNLTNKDVLTLLATKNIGLESKPGTRFGYCNTNYALLALIIEKVTQKTYPTVLQEMIFDPLGMKNTFVFHNLKDKDTV